MQNDHIYNYERTRISQEEILDMLYDAENMLFVICEHDKEMHTDTFAGIFTPEEDIAKDFCSQLNIETKQIKYTYKAIEIAHIGALGAYFDKHKDCPLLYFIEQGVVFEENVIEKSDYELNFCLRILRKLKTQIISQDLYIVTQGEEVLVEEGVYPAHMVFATYEEANREIEKRICQKMNLKEPITIINIPFEEIANNITTKYITKHTPIFIQGEFLIGYHLIKAAKQIWLEETLGFEETLNEVVFNDFYLLYDDQDNIVTYKSKAIVFTSERSANMIVENIDDALSRDYKLKKYKDHSELAEVLKVLLKDRNDYCYINTSKHAFLIDVIDALEYSEELIEEM